ncbi:CdaR family transcriptional regulator [Actinoplanes sp. TBRC 11911]|uniref:PucR family transcriptional regulator n=1 Tax=Actinoplanes sp. TBRC 11911 TaxID=2729386 RepID=UPI001B7D58FC|nr:helix-turn-helix domain-containing protein [Actinoplanes sp. TBRC 11911]
MRSSESVDDGKEPFGWPGRSPELDAYLDRIGQEPKLHEMLPVLFRRLPEMLDEVRVMLANSWPDYAEFLAQEQAEVTGAAEAFMLWLIDTAEHGGAESLRERPVGNQLELFEEIGRVQWREGREVSTLLSAYQVGARVAWRYVSGAALETGVEPDTLAALAEAVFAFVDQLSSASARGYVMEQSLNVAERELLRDELVELLLSDRSDSTAVRAAAIRAGWTLPREAAVILLAVSSAMGHEVLNRLDSSCLIIHRRALLGAIVPDPVRPGRRQRLSTALAGTGAVVGHPVPLEQLPVSVQFAELTARLRAGGILTDDPVFVEDHLDALIVHRDAKLLEALREQALAPLARLAPTTRERLSETLGAWLRHMGDRQAVAAELHIHPQTVRYRMSQLHAAFGRSLDDPATRTRLTLALAWGTAAEPNLQAPESDGTPPPQGRRRKAV